MNPKVSYTLVGLFVVLLGSGLVTALVWISSSASGRNYDTYVAYMYESVSGLNDNAPVTYRGVDVGFVREIALDEDRPDRVRLMLDIERGTPIKDDTLAILVTQGLTGLAKVELTGGSIESPHLQARPGARYPEIQTGPSLLVRIDQAITTLVTSMDGTIQQLRFVAQRLEVLLSDANQRAIAGTLHHIESLTGALSDRSDGLQASLDAVQEILANASEASVLLPDLVQRADQGLATIQNTAETIGSAVDAFERTAESITVTAGTVDGLIADIGDDLSAFTQNTPAQIDQLIAELQRVSENLEHFTRDLDRDPNMMFFGRPEVPPGPGEED